MSNKSKKGRRGAPTGPNPVLIGSAIVGVVVLVILAVVYIANNDSNDNSTDVPVEAKEYGAITIDGQALPSMSDSADAAVGQPAPTVISERAAGTVRLDPAADTQPIVVAFLAHWCPHCQRELPLLVDLARQGVFDGVHLVAVATSTDPNKPNFPPSAWLADEQWPGDILYDDQTSTAAAAYGLTGFPMIVFIGADGNVVSRISGEQPAEAIQAEVDKITAGASTG